MAPKRQLQDLAAQVRILGCSLARQHDRGAVSPTAAVVIEGAREAHDSLDRALNRSTHSLSRAVRLARAGGCIETGLADKLARLARAADVLRHVTPYSVELILADLATQTAPGFNADLDASSSTEKAKDQHGEENTVVDDFQRQPVAAELVPGQSRSASLKPEGKNPKAEVAVATPSPTAASTAKPDIVRNVHGTLSPCSTTPPSTSPLPTSPGSTTPPSTSPPKSSAPNCREQGLQQFGSSSRALSLLSQISFTAHAHPQEHGCRCGHKTCGKCQMHKLPRHDDAKTRVPRLPPDPHRVSFLA